MDYTLAKQLKEAGFKQPKQVDLKSFILSVLEKQREDEVETATAWMKQIEIEFFERGRASALQEVRKKVDNLVGNDVPFANWGQDGADAYLLALHDVFFHLQDL